MKDDLVSVIIPAYQSAAFLPDAIESVLNQSYNSIEIIVVDDGSTDDTVKTLQPYKNEIRYIFQENSGQAAARNTGIQVSNGSFFAFLDADDMWLPHKLEKQIPLFQNNPDVGLVFGDIYYFTGQIKQAKTSFTIYPPSRGTVFTQLFIQNFIPLSTAVIRKKITDQIGLFNPDLNPVEDYEYWLRISKHFPVDYVNEVVCGYRIQPNQSTSNIQKMWGQFVKVQQAALSNQENNLTSLPTIVLERCFYNKYLKLALNSMEQHQDKQAQIWLREYATSRGKTPAWCLFQLLRVIPASIRDHIIQVRKSLFTHPELGRY